MKYNGDFINVETFYSIIGLSIDNLTSDIVSEMKGDTNSNLGNEQ